MAHRSTSTPWRISADGRTTRQRVHGQPADRPGLGGDHRRRAHRARASRAPSCRRSRATSTAGSSRSSSARSRPQFKGQASFIERDDTAHTATLKAEGRDTGGRGNASAEIAAPGREPVADVDAGRRHHRPAHHRQGRPVRSRHHRRRLQEADGAVRRQPQHDARRRARGTNGDCRRGRGARRRRRDRATTDHVASRERVRAATRARPPRPPPSHRRSARSTARRASPSTSPGWPARRSSSGWPPSSWAAAAAVHPAPTPVLSGPAGPMDGDDVARVTALLGRPPQGPFEVVVRDETASPSSSATRPFLDDGTPMPTRYWLVGRRAVLAVSRLEAAGGVARAEAEIDAAAIEDAHRRYAAERDAAIGRHAHGPGLPAASAARARASSACTPTTPGTSPAATTPSAAGSPASWRPASTSRSGPTSTLVQPRRPRRAGSPSGRASCWPPTSSTPTRRRRSS